MRSSTCCGAGWLGDCSDLPPRTTVYRWFAQWRDTGLFETMNHLLVMADRERVGREPSPSAAVLDSQRRCPTKPGTLARPEESASTELERWSGSQRSYPRQQRS